MNAYKLFLVREGDKGFYREAEVLLAHMVPPTLTMHPQSQLTEENARSLMDMASRGVLGERLRVDLNTFLPLPPLAPPENPVDSAIQKMEG